MSRIYRPQPVGPSRAYQTFAVRQPMNTHFKIINCVEADCSAYHNGWFYRLDDLTSDLLGAIRQSGRRYRQEHVGLDGRIMGRMDVNVPPGEYLVFPPGQQCFRTHRVSLERPAFYFTGSGDFRTFTTQSARRIAEPEQFVDEFETNLDAIRSIRQRG